MKVIIIEDEKPSARRLQRMLSKFCIEVQTLLHSIEESLEWFKDNTHPDLIFLDIQLNDGLSFEIFEAIEIKSRIIFTTAYDEYAIKAFKLNSVDYLLKPIDADELAIAVNKAKIACLAEKKVFNLEINDIKKMLIGSTNQKYKKRFSIKVGQRIKLIYVHDIECFYSENKGTYLHTITGRDYLLDISLEDLGKELEPQTFFRINRKFYININAINDMLSYSNSRLQIKLNTYKEQEIIVARERLKEFKAWLE